MDTNELKERFSELTDNLRDAKDNYKHCMDELATALKYRDEALLQLVKEEVALDAFKKENSLDLFTKFGTI